MIKRVKGESVITLIGKSKIIMAILAKRVYRKYLIEKEIKMREMTPYVDKIVFPINTFIIFPIQKIIKEYSVNKYLFIFFGVFLLIGILVVCSLLMHAYFIK